MLVFRESPDVRGQLLAHARPLIQKRNRSPNVQDQLEALAPDVEVATVKLSSVELDWLKRPHDSGAAQNALQPLPSK